MKINNDWKIEAIDDKNVALIKINIVKSGKNEGNEVEVVKGYYRDCKQALKSLVRYEINGEGLRDFETVVAKIELLEKMIDSLKI